MSFQTHTTLELRSCFDISHEIKPQSRPLQTDFNSLAMTSWSRFLSCALKAAESENTEYLNIYWHTQRPYRPLYPPPPLTYCQCSVDLCYPVRFCYLPLKQKVVQFDNEKCYLLNYDLLMSTPTTTLNLPLQQCKCSNYLLYSLEGIQLPETINK